MVFNDRFCPDRDTTGAATYVFANCESHTDIHADTGRDAFAQRFSDTDSETASYRNANPHAFAQSNSAGWAAGSDTVAYPVGSFMAFACAISNAASSTGACAHGYTATFRAGSRRAAQALLP